MDKLKQKISTKLVEAGISKGFKQASESYQQEGLKLQNLLDKQTELVNKFKKSSADEKEKLKKEIVNLHKEVKNQTAKFKTAETKFNKALLDEPEDLDESVNEETEYQKFFKTVLSKFDVESPDDLSTEKQKEFFDYIDKNWDAKNESINESISVFDERLYNKGKGIIIMLQKDGKKTSAIFKKTRNADKFDRNDPADLEKLYQIAKKTPFPKAIDESINESNKKYNSLDDFEDVAKKGSVFYLGNESGFKRSNKNDYFTVVDTKSDGTLIVTKGTSSKKYTIGANRYDEPVIIVTESINENFSAQDIETIKGVVKTTGNLMGLRDPLKAAGFKKIDFSFSPIPHMTIKKGRKSFVLLSKKYADDPDFEVGGIAGGLLEGMINEASEGHIKKKGKDIYVDTTFINRTSGVLPNSEVKHMGFGEFYLQTPNGDVQFARTGESIKGFEGRAHKMYDDAGGKIVKELLKKMLKDKRAVMEAYDEECDECDPTVNEETEYQKFFKMVLSKFDVESPDDLSTEKQKEFFDYIDKNWDAKNESINEAVEPSNTINGIFRVANSKQAKKIDGVLVDLQTASLLGQIWDVANDNVKKKLNKLDAKGVGSIVWKIAKK